MGKTRETLMIERKLSECGFSLEVPLSDGCRIDACKTILDGITVGCEIKVSYQDLRSENGHNQEKMDIAYMCVPHYLVNSTKKFLKNNGYHKTGIIAAYFVGDDVILNDVCDGYTGDYVTYLLGKTTAKSIFNIADKNELIDSIYEYAKGQEVDDSKFVQINKRIAASNIKVPDGYKLVVKEAKTQRMQLVFKPSTAEKLKAAAHAAGKSVNDYISCLLDDTLG